MRLVADLETSKPAERLHVRNQHQPSSDELYQSGCLKLCKHAGHDFPDRSDSDCDLGTRRGKFNDATAVDRCSAFFGLFEEIFGNPLLRIPQSK